MQTNDNLETPKCKYFGECGGCSFQHVPYKTQINNKKQKVFDLIKKSGISILNPEISVNFHEPYGYRNRMDLVFTDNGCGLRKKNKWNHVIKIDNCPISNSKLNEILVVINTWIKNNELDIFDLEKQNGTLKYVVIRTPEYSSDTCVSFILNSDSMKISDTIEKIKLLCSDYLINNIIVGYVSKKTDESISTDIFVLKGNRHIIENIADFKFKYDSQGFFQNNSIVADKMVRYVRDLNQKNDTSNAFLLDLYGGVGTFGISLSKQFNEVLTVESFLPSTKYALENIKLNDLKNVSATCLDVMQLKKLDILKQAKSRELFVITDPPRSGMHPKTIEHLILLKPKNIIYISCNPEQLSKELIKFSKYYSVQSIAIFDLFAQTPHVEVVVELKLN